MKNKIKDYLQLSKLKIMIPVSLTGFTGYFICTPAFSLRLILVTFGILFLAVSASVLNQIQEAGPDSIMDRTHNRPIPSGRISFRQAFVFFILNLSAGSLLIFYAGNSEALIVGIITIFWYNGIYTYAKKVTAFAVFPGAITGALPPLIGWIAAGCEAWEKPVIFLQFVMFTGQIPHFWLLVLRYGKEYEKAGFPSLTAILRESQIKRLTFTWINLTVLAGLFLSYFGIIQTRAFTGILVMASILLVWQCTGLLREREDKSNFRKYAVLLNSYYLVILVLLITEKIIR